MATRETPFAPGTPCWVELLSSDPDKSKAFYGELLGWTYQSSGPEFGDYITAFSDGHAVAGMMANTPEMASPDVWATYLASADVEATAAAATEAGASVLVAPMTVGDVGKMAVLFDPAGAAVGVWEAGTHSGFGKYNEPGAVTWDEINSTNLAATVAFYEKVFGWTIDKMSDTDAMRYYLGQIDGQTVAGMADAVSFLPPGVPSHWVVYFSVPDADEALAAVTKLGGTVLRPAEDTPFGRMADAMDSTGTPFKIHSEKLLNPQAAEG
jgi:uncharacterized protein